jgi:hypothetical protein
VKKKSILEKQFFELNENPDPWEFKGPDPTNEDKKMSCPPAVPESCWAHSVVAEVTEYLQKDTSNIATCFDCKDAYDILKSSIPARLSNRIYYANEPHPMAKVGMLVYSYWTPVLDRYLANSDVSVGLVYSPEWVSKKGAGKLLKFINEYESRWMGLDGVRYRAFRFTNISNVRRSYKKGNKKIVTFLKQWPTIRENVPEMKLTNSKMRDVLSCFSVLVVQPYYEPTIEDMMMMDVETVKSTSMPFKILDTSVCMPGFDVERDPTGKTTVRVDVVKYKIELAQNVFYLSISDGRTVQRFRRNCPEFDGTGCVIAHGIRKERLRSGEVPGSDLRMGFVYKWSSIIYAYWGKNKWIPPGDVPDWLMNIFYKVNIQALVVSDGPHDYVVNPNCHGLYECGEDRIEVSPISRYHPSFPDTLPTFWLLTTQRTLGEFKKLVGEFSAI